jgi:hypothetical protein
VRPATGAGDDARQIEHPDACERTLAFRPWLRGGVADLFDRDQRQFGERPGVRRRRPFVMRAHQGDDAAIGVGGGLERLAIPLHQRGLDLVTLRLAVQHLADRVAMMRKIGVQPNAAVIAGLVDAGNRIPGRRRRLAVDAQVTLAPAFDHGMAHIDRNLLALPAAQFPDPGRRQPGRGNTRLRRGSDTKRRRQLRLFARQRERVERGRLAAGRCPDLGENFAWAFYRAIHEPLPSDVQICARPAKELQWLRSIP